MFAGTRRVEAPAPSNGFESAGGGIHLHRRPRCWKGSRARKSASTQPSHDSRTPTAALGLKRSLTSSYVRWPGLLPKNAHGDGGLMKGGSRHPSFHAGFSEAIPVARRVRALNCPSNESFRSWQSTDPPVHLARFLQCPLSDAVFFSGRIYLPSDRPKPFLFRATDWHSNCYRL
jgi:hypothetical protein